jgi:hypothetical protein
MGSPLAKQYGLHLHRVGIAECPQGYVARLIDMTPKEFRRLRLSALEVHDLVLAKLARNSPRDRADVEFLVGKGALDEDLLETRFESELRPYVLNEARDATTLHLWLEEFFGTEAL